MPMPRQSRPLGIRRSGEIPGDVDCTPRGDLMKNDESSSPLLEIIPNNGEKHGTTRPRITGLGWFGIWWRMMGVHGLVLPFEWKWKQILWYPAEELLLSAGGH